MDAGTSGSIRPSPEQPLYFLHIPKTAGTSAITFLQRLLEAGAYCPAQNWGTMARLTREQAASYGVYHGHFQNLLDGYIGKRTTKFTFVREPVAATISFYGEVKRTPESVMNIHASLFDFVADDGTFPGNFQCEQLIAASEFLVSGEEDTPWVNSVLERIRALDPTERVARAKHAICEMAFAAPTERLDDGLYVLSHLLGRYDATRIPRENVGARKLRPEDLDERTRHLIEEKTWADRELWEFVCRRFEEHWPPAFFEGAHVARREAERLAALLEEERRVNALAAGALPESGVLGEGARTIAAYIRERIAEGLDLQLRRTAAAEAGTLAVGEVRDAALAALEGYRATTTHLVERLKGLSEARDALAAEAAEAGWMRDSWSWRVTKPLRAAKRLARRPQRQA